MFWEGPQMLQLELDEQERQHYSRNRINYNKKAGKLQKQARQEAKLNYCYYCKKEVSSLCNSHSVPQFCLRRIATDGKLYYLNTLIDLPFMRNEQGINEAGTFMLICRDCDSKIFQQYEDPAAYQTKPTGQMLAQIAMKNYMQMIYKRHNEDAFYKLMGTELGTPQNFVDHNHEIISLDLSEYSSSFNRAKIGSLGKHDYWYYLCYYKRLNYTVPIAFQGGIVMTCDFEDDIINDIYNMSPDYHTKEIHIAVFPLEQESVIMLFIDARDNRYRKFYRQLNKLPLEEQLSAINYIIFSYSENVYISEAQSPAIPRPKRSRCRSSQEVNDSPTPFSALNYCLPALPMASMSLSYPNMAAYATMNPSTTAAATIYHTTAMALIWQ